MTTEQRLREDLRSAAAPPGLTPPPGLADTVLTTQRRRHRTRMATVAAAAVALVAVGVPAGLHGLDGRSGRAPVDPAEQPAAATPANPSPRTTPDFPAPGDKGQRSVHVYRTETATWLLDSRTAEYRKVPFPVTVSPDGATVAVTKDDSRTGVADRADYLRRGAAAVRWLDVPTQSATSWSPDGRSLLITALVKGQQAVRFSAWRYDVATRRTESTGIQPEILGSTIGWAADSTRFLVLLPGKRSNDTVEPGGLRYVDPDGTLGARIDGDGGLVGGADAYSSSRRLLIADTSQLMTANRLPSPVIEVANGREVGYVPAGLVPMGWYSERVVAGLTTDDLYLVRWDVRDDKQVGRIALNAVPGLISVQLGPPVAPYAF